MSSARPFNVLLLAHDLSDAAIKRRVKMLITGGATVRLAGFRKWPTPIENVEGCPAIDLGQTYNGKFVKRFFAVLRILVSIGRYTSLFKDTDLILARNLEMLAIAVRGISRNATDTPLVYECLDIHRLMLKQSVIGKSLRFTESRLARRACLLLTSSPAFIDNYFNGLLPFLPTKIIENKILEIPEGDCVSSVPAPCAPGPPWKIGWFGILRCNKSLFVLRELVLQCEGLVEVIIRGKPAADQLGDFENLIAQTPGMTFQGPYRYPEDLAAIYRDVHFSWAVDMFEEGMNSSWLLPNRLYEGGAFGVVPIAQEQVEVGRFLKRNNVGLAIGDPMTPSLVNFFKELTPDKYKSMESAVNRLPATTWAYSNADCVSFVNCLRSLSEDLTEDNTDIHDPCNAQVVLANTCLATKTLIVVPCLNEEPFLDKLISKLAQRYQGPAYCIVIADGGSTDRSPEIARALAHKYPHVRFMKNPHKLQSSGINLAVEKYGKNAQYLIRLDAHADYPEDFCERLLGEAERTGADSVVVSMTAEGAGWFQRAVAIAQNSKLGNGGSAHRSATNEGMWVDHGHHALMRIKAFRAVKGYDETFSHNEDAELDTRLGRAGYQIWLTADTSFTYFPRSCPLRLFHQYIDYGYGRARNLIKHRTRPKLRQLAPAVVVPAAMLALLSPLMWVAALPLGSWATLCIGYGFYLGVKTHNPATLASGPAAMLMHLGWSWGFWKGVLTAWRDRP